MQHKNRSITAHTLPSHAPAHSARSSQQKGGEDLFETLAVALIAFWSIALGFGYILDGYIHTLLLGAIVMTLLHFKQGRCTPYSGSGSFQPKEIK